MKINFKKSGNQPSEVQQGGSGCPSTPTSSTCTTVGYESVRTSEGYFLTDPSTVKEKKIKFEYLAKIASIANL